MRWNKNQQQATCKTCRVTSAWNCNCNCPPLICSSFQTSRSSLSSGNSFVSKCQGLETTGGCKMTMVCVCWGRWCEQSVLSMVVSGEAAAWVSPDWHCLVCTVTAGRTEMVTTPATLSCHRRSVWPGLSSLSCPRDSRQTREHCEYSGRLGSSSPGHCQG